MPFIFIILVFLLALCLRACSYEAPEDKEDIFARRACPAFLTFTNIAHQDGTTVELPCHCKPPQVQSVVWFFRKHSGSSEETTVLSDLHGNRMLDTNQVPQGGDLRSRFSIRLFGLLIFRATPEDTGIYLCGSTHKDVFYGYDLDIQETRSIVFSPSLAPEGRSEQLKGGKVSSEPLYRIFTNFRPWTVCDRCGERGEQVRVGLCYIHSQFLHVRYRRTNETVASCGSGAVPKSFSDPKTSRTGAILEVKSCLVTCPVPPTPSSKFVALMGFLGYSSASLPAEVPVFYLKHPADHVLTLGCPGAQSHMAVAWDRGEVPLHRSDHLAGSDADSASSRLKIDTGHHLVFTPAKTQDSGVYYCWLQGRRAAELRLLVYVSFGRGQSVTSHPDFPMAIRTVLVWYAIMAAVFGLLLMCRAGVRYLLRTAESHSD